jgi:hypothetical protein
MWVWSDELANRFPAIQGREGVGVPLIAYAVEQEVDLEALAREIVRSLGEPSDVVQPDHSGPSTRGR